MLLVPLLASFAVPAFSLLTTPREQKNVKRDVSLQDSLFPPSETYMAGFTTAEGVQVEGVTQVPLSDEALGAFKIASETGHELVQVQNKTCWQAVYPEGSYSFGGDIKGGFSLYLNGTPEFASIMADGAYGAMFGYSVLFENGFEWNKGGKLPGGYGGQGSLAQACSGGRQDNRDECFDLRLMWRTNGTGELYTYLPLTQQNADAQNAVPPLTVINNDYGFSVGRGSFSFASNRWYTIAERIIMNHPGAYDGQVDVWVDGQNVIALRNISMRTSLESKIQGMHFITFFGGSTSDWASPATQAAYFADISGAVITSSSFW